MNAFEDWLNENKKLYVLLRTTLPLAQGITVFILFTLDIFFGDYTILSIISLIIFAAVITAISLLRKRYQNEFEQSIQK